MKRAILALEENENITNAEPAEEVSSETIDESSADLKEEMREIREEVEVVEEATNMSEAITDMSQTVEAAVETGEGLPQAAAEVLETALEHFYTRLGVSRRLTPVLESFEKDRLQSSKLTLENMQILSGKLDKKLALSQEGIFERMGNAMKRFFTNRQEIRSAVVRFKVERLKEQVSLKTPAWGRVFALSDKDEVNGEDIYKVCVDVLKAGTEATRAFTKAAALLRDAKGELNRKTFGAAEGAVEYIEKIGKEIVGLIEKAIQSVPANLLADKKDITVISCDPASFAKLQRLVSEKATEDALNKAWTELWEAYIDISQQQLHPIVQLAAMGSADRRAVNRVLQQINKLSFDSIDKITDYEHACFHGVYKYLLASIDK